MMFPTTQRQLLALARGDKKRREFAADMKIDRTAWSRYETEKRRVPTGLLNKLLKLVHERLAQEAPVDPKEAAMQFAKATLREIARIDDVRAESQRSAPLTEAAEGLKLKRVRTRAARRKKKL